MLSHWHGIGALFYLRHCNSIEGHNDLSSDHHAESDEDSR